MGIHDVDRAHRLVGSTLEDVHYVRSDQIAEYDVAEGRDIAETVVLTASGDSFTVWISEGSCDRLAVAGEVTEVCLSQPLVKMPAAARPPWNKVIGSTISRVRTATTRAGERKPRRSSEPMTQALELTFESGQAITLAGFNPDLDLATTWFDDVAVLDCPLDSIAGFESRTITVH